jgi:hypothetical protein
MPSMVQPIAITKLVSPLRGGRGLEVIPLPIQTFTIFVLVANVANELVKGSEKPNKEQVEHVNPSFTTLNNRVKSLEFLYASLLLTPHQIGMVKRLLKYQVPCMP